MRFVSNCFYVYVSESGENETSKVKKLHNVFLRNSEFRDCRTWHWLKKGYLEKATENTLMAAQGEATRTRSLQRHIEKDQISPRCRLCGKRGGTVTRRQSIMLVYYIQRRDGTRWNSKHHVSSCETFICLFLWFWFVGQVSCRMWVVVEMVCWKNSSLYCVARCRSGSCEERLVHRRSG